MESGEVDPNAIFNASKDGFATAMTEARELLGLGHLSTITRTEPAVCNLSPVGSTIDS